MTITHETPWPTPSEDNPLDRPCRLVLERGEEIRQFKCLADLAEAVVLMAYQEFDADLTTYISWLDGVALSAKLKIAKDEQAAK